jgi:hypothetical protein
MSSETWLRGLDILPLIVNCWADRIRKVGRIILATFGRKTSESAGERSYSR